MGEIKMKSKYTPGKLTIDFEINEQGPCIFPQNGGSAIAVVYDYRDPLTGAQLFSVKADADRLVECWNSCEGIAEPSVMPEILKAFRGILDQFSKDQRAGCIQLSEAMREELNRSYAAMAKAGIGIFRTDQPQRRKGDK